MQRDYSKKNGWGFYLKYKGLSRTQGHYCLLVITTDLRVKGKLLKAKRKGEYFTAGRLEKTKDFL